MTQPEASVERATRPPLCSGFPPGGMSKLGAALRFLMSAENGRGEGSGEGSNAVGRVCAVLELALCLKAELGLEPADKRPI